MQEKLATYQVPKATIQEQWDNFELTLKKEIDEFIPSKPCKPTNHKPWINRDILTIVNQRNRANKHSRKSKTEPNKQKYITLKKQCQSRTCQAHKDYTENIFN